VNQLSFTRLAALACGLGSIALGQSVNWDLLNYHLYDPHAFVTGRWRIDVAPAQLQSYFNPLLHLPYYLGFQYLDHVALAFLLGLVQGLSALPLYLLAMQVLPAVPERGGAAFVAVALGLLGPVFVSELGTMFGDTVLAPAILTSLLLVIRAPERESATWSLRLAGALAGGATALKLPFAIYSPGLLLAWLVVAPDSDARVRGTIAFGIAWLAGSLALGLFWALHLWHFYGNPLFPFFNDWFGSPWTHPWDFKDRRFLPHGLAEALVYPFVALRHPERVMERAFRDLRPALVYGLVLALPLLAWQVPRLRLPRPLAAVLTFAGATFAAWIAQFGIYRYLAVVEMLAPLALLGVLLHWFGRRREAARGVLTAVVLTQLAVVVPDWGRMPFGILMPPRAAFAFAPDAMVLSAGGEPTAFVALAFPDTVPVVRVTSNFLRLGDDTRLADEARRKVAEHAGSFYVLAAASEIQTVLEDLAHFGVTTTTLACAPLFPGPLPSLGSQIVFCPATRTRG
jgi:hypothetical protein